MFIPLLGMLGMLFLGLNIYATDIQDSEYFYFYWQGCSHCIRVERYFEQSKVDKKVQISAHEIWYDQEWLETLESLLPRVNLSLEQVGTPLLIIKSADGDYSSLMGDAPIIEYFKQVESQFAWLEQVENADIPSNSRPESIVSNIENRTGYDKAMSWVFVEVQPLGEKKSLAEQPLKFLAVMLPAALSDSINPCAFAVMLLLLGTILSKSKNKRRTIWAGILFSLAIFGSYFLMGLWVYSLLETTEWGTNYTVIFKRIVGLLWLLVGLANLKDFFWYGKGFVMEVPMAWRPRMMKIIQTVVSPRGAFFIGIIVSLFLLPCSSGPYFVILGLLRSESSSLTQLGVNYLILYNFIFILPMLVITFLVGLGYSSVDQLAKIKNRNTRLIHLIVGLLMIGLGAYVIGSLYW